MLTRYRWKSWKEQKAPEQRDYLGDFESASGPKLPDDYLWIDLCGGSDYSGNAVNVANYRWFKERFGELPGVIDIYGGYSTYGIMVRRDCWTDDMREVLTGLRSYCIIDEELHSEVETEAEVEAWDSWAADDFRRALVKRWPELEDHLDDLTQSALLPIFEQAREDANVYWENETGNSAAIDVERVAAAVEYRDVLPAPKGDEPRYCGECGWPIGVPGGRDGGEWLGGFHRHDDGTVHMALPRPEAQLMLPVVLVPA